MEKKKQKFLNMTKDRKNTSIYLIDIRYKYSMNCFEEHYGDSVTYSSVEQESYIDLKSMIFELISDKVKFRKYERNKMVLTLKVEMLDEELEKLRYLLKERQIKFLHDYEISNIRKFNLQ